MGYENRKTFAAFLGMTSFGEGPIRDVEQGKRVLRDQEIVLVAEKCGLPRTFFTADRAQLGPTSGEVPDDIAERLDRIERLLSGEGDDSHGDATP